MPCVPLYAKLAICRQTCGKPQTEPKFYADPGCLFPEPLLNLRPQPTRDPVIMMVICRHVTDFDQTHKIPALQS